MGFFDVTIAEELQSPQEVTKLKEELISQLKKQSFEASDIDNTTVIQNYKTDNAFLNYDIKFKDDKNFLIIEAELKQVIILTILILLAILFTYGIGVVLIVAFAYYQRVITSKALTALIKKIRGTDIA